MSNPFAHLNLSFRPSAMHFPLLLSRVKGTARRQELMRAMAEERLEELPPQYLQSALSHEERSAFGALHPALMGGEYLPDFLKDEVEVARIELASTTADVISVRMRPTKKGLVYRVVDEYMSGGAGNEDDDDTQEESRGDDGMLLVDAKPLVSKLPLTLGELGRYAVKVAGVENMVLMHEFFRLEDALAFIEGSSVYYPEFGLYLEAFIASVMPEYEEEDEDNEEDDEEDEE